MAQNALARLIGHHRRIVEFLARRDGDGVAVVTVEQGRYLAGDYSKAATARP
jgi:hypothetical protein